MLYYLFRGLRCTGSERLDQRNTKNVLVLCIGGLREVETEMNTDERSCLGEVGIVMFVTRAPRHRVFTD